MRVNIYGRGPIAIALVLFLRRQGVAPTRISVEASQAAVPDAVASRPLALSEGSVQLLNRLVQMPTGAAIEQVDIGVLKHGLHSRLRPGDIGLKVLGRVVRYGNLWSALQQALEQSQQSCHYWFAEPDWQDDDVLHIIADGKPDQNASLLDFHQAALTTELLVPSDSSMPAPGIAYERFKPDGPLALLPLPEPRRLALVWCLSSERAGELLDASQPEFERALSIELGSRFSHMTLSAPRYLTPLTRSTQKLGTSTEKETTSLRLGNAAQTLHPVAGQGMNLGLRDAFETAAILATGLKENADADAIYKRVTTQRHKDRQQTIALTDQLARLADKPKLSGLNNGATQSMTIGLLDVIGPARRALTKRFVFGQRKPN
ncbi:MAG: FAD-dependent monooxygenase [Burkholderiaceae bacterium]